MYLKGLVRKPTIFVFDMENANKSIRKAMQIPMGYIPIPLVAVNGAFIPIVLGIGTLILKLVGVG